MPRSIQFAKYLHYRATGGIDVPVELCAGRQRVELVARLDTGAAYCIFEGRYAEELGLDLASGRVQRFRTMAGSFEAYEHEITIHTIGIEFTSFVFFARDKGFNRNFLGRSGWLDRIRLGIVDYDQLLLLSPYDS
ncbi:MAG: hypothetical protein U0Q16_39200 [Bryobacteraceae bacterium]